MDNGLLWDLLVARLWGFLWGLVVVLAVIGLYGVISYIVARRRSEIGIRMSLGAGRGSIVALVLRESLLLLAIGLTVGVALALGASRAAASLLFGLKPHDGATLVMAIVILAVIWRRVMCRRCGLRGWIRWRRCGTSRVWGKDRKRKRKRKTKEREKITQRRRVGKDAQRRKADSSLRSE
jgi:predicted lysophospholipase L1 biosynthesis ABC-type transport system permease subunit